MLTVLQLAFIASCSDAPKVESTFSESGSPGIIVVPTTGLVTAEGGKSASFNVKLSSQPQEAVVVSFSGDATEGSFPSSINLTHLNWQEGIDVTVTGADDAIFDGNILYVIQATAASNDSNYSSIDPSDVSVTNEENDFKTFRTATGYDGSLGGPSGADGNCSGDANYPGTGTYKVMIVDGTTRRACSTANCSGGASENIDWVLKPDSEYYQSDGTTKIMKTNSSGIFVFGTLDNQFAASGFPTGMNQDWTPHADNCSSWSSTAGNSLTSFGGQTNAQSISFISLACTSTAGLLCIEQ